MKKFRKVAAKPGLSANLPNFTSFANFMDFVKESPEEKLKEFFSGENSKRNLNYLAGLLMGWTTDRYSPKAFEHALDVKGYDNTEASQGAYEIMSPDIKTQLENFKKNPPSNLTDFVTGEPVKSFENITVPETSERYKAMQEKLYPTTASEQQKFIKTSQANRNEELAKIMPKWTIENVLNDMANVAKNPRLSNAEKQKSMFDVLNNYERSIAPLSNYLDKNGIKFK